MKNSGSCPATGKLMERLELANVVREAKAAGRTVVFTNGCFDILHVGHVRYLKEARALGDVLVLGVNSDDSVRRLKGPERPINSEDDRAEVLAALECVDYVTIFAEDTPVELIAAIRPDIDVKGGDYVIEDMPEAKVMHSIGGRVEIIPFSATDSKGFSTTGTLLSMKRKGADTKGTG